MTSPYLGPPQSDTCKANLLTLNWVFARLGVPLAPEKQEGLATSLAFLGIMIDTEKGNSASQLTSRSVY